MSRVQPLNVVGNYVGTDIIINPLNGNGGVINVMTRYSLRNNSDIIYLP